ncbi:Efflux ABC transporter, ATP-binding protein [hydrothermal vent metagenome]|uniref:Efflux ABC transporter, ATP-binding protein n=1 Tax=hydrothermal vent metagenome TaxID=652676 RepID=A0A3B1A8M6_9ZZZZ
MISINGLTFYYPKCDTPVLDDINLTIEEGSLYGLLGPNGAGKSTLIALLTGLYTDNSNAIFIKGKPLTSQLSKIKQCAGYIPQDYAFYPNLTGTENLDFFSGIQGLSSPLKKQRIEYCLDFCQLQAVANQHASKYSGGLKRRLNIAIGLLTDPEIIYFDEPTVGIDPQSRSFILEKILDLNQQGKTIIYTSHYMEEIEKICDKVAILDHGKILVHGSLNELKNTHNLQLIIECTHTPNTEALKKLNTHYTLQASPSRLVFDNMQTIDDCADTLKLLSSLDIPVTQVTYGKMSLETLFMQLTSKSLRD